MPYKDAEQAKRKRQERQQQKAEDERRHFRPKQWQVEAGQQALNKVTEEIADIVSEDGRSLKKKEEKAHTDKKEKKTDQDTKQKKKSKKDGEDTKQRGEIEETKGPKEAHKDKKAHKDKNEKKTETDTKQKKSRKDGQVTKQKGEIEETKETDEAKESEDHPAPGQGCAVPDQAYKETKETEELKAPGESSAVPDEADNETRGAPLKKESLEEDVRGKWWRRQWYQRPWENWKRGGQPAKQTWKWEAEAPKQTEEAPHPLVKTQDKPDRKTSAKLVQDLPLQTPGWEKAVSQRLRQGAVYFRTVGPAPHSQSQDPDLFGFQYDMTCPCKHCLDKRERDAIQAKLVQTAAAKAVAA